MLTPQEALDLFLSCLAAEDEGQLEAPRASLAEQRTITLEFLLLPSTGGACLLASCRSSASFRAALGGLTLSRPIWRLARGLLAGLSRVGLHRFVGLKQIRGELPVRAPGESLDFSLQSGVPGGGQKWIVREHAPDGKPCAFWKLGTPGLPAQLVEAEARALAWLAAHPAGRSLGPKPLSSGNTADHAWLRMQALHGSRVPASNDGLLADFIAELAVLQPVQCALQASAWQARMLGRLDEFQTAAMEVAGLCRQALAWIAAKSGDGQLRFHPAHGDLTPWNALLQAKRLVAFDWEFFDADAPAGLDRLHWTFQQGILVERLEPAALKTKALGQVGALLKLPVSQAEMYLAMYLVELLSRDESIFLHGKPEFEQVDWLLAARREILNGICQG